MHDYVEMWVYFCLFFCLCLSWWVLCLPDIICTCTTCHINPPSAASILAILDAEPITPRCGLKRITILSVVLAHTESIFALLFTNAPFFNDASTVCLRATRGMLKLSVLCLLCLPQNRPLASGLCSYIHKVSPFKLPISGNSALFVVHFIIENSSLFA